MFKGFKDFITRGNVIDLAVAVVIGAAFTAIVTAIVDNVFNPLIGALFNANSLAKSLPVTIPTASGGQATLQFGAVIAAAINFIIVAAVVYFVFVMPIARFNAKRAELRAQGVVAEPAAPTELDLLTEIRDLLATPHATGIDATHPTGTTAATDADGTGSRPS